MPIPSLPHRRHRLHLGLYTAEIYSGYCTDPQGDNRKRYKYRTTVEESTREGMLPVNRTLGESIKEKQARTG